MPAPDLTDRLINREAQHKVSSRWPVLAFVAGAVVGVMVAISVGSNGIWIDTTLDANGRMVGQLNLYAAGRMWVEWKGNDLQGLERQMNLLSGGLIAGGMLGGGLAGLAGVWAARTAFARVAGPDGLV